MKYYSGKVGAAFVEYGTKRTSQHQKIQVNIICRKIHRLYLFGCKRYFNWLPIIKKDKTIIGEHYAHLCDEPDEKIGELDLITKVEKLKIFHIHIVGVW